MIHGSGFSGNVYLHAEFPVRICQQQCLTGGFSGGIVSFGKESQVYLKKYAVSEKFLERFEIKITIALAFSEYTIKVDALSLIDFRACGTGIISLLKYFTIIELHACCFSQEGF